MEHILRHAAEETHRVPQELQAPHPVTGARRRSRSRPCSAEQLKGVLDRGESVQSIPPELYPFPEFFQEVPEPQDEDDWLAQFNESKDSYQVRLAFSACVLSARSGVEALILRCQLASVRERHTAVFR